MFFPLACYSIEQEQKISTPLPAVADDPVFDRHAAEYIDLQVTDFISNL